MSLSLSNTQQRVYVRNIELTCLVMDIALLEAGDDNGCIRNIWIPAPSIISFACPLTSRLAQLAP